MKNYTNTDLKRIEAEIRLMEDTNYHYKNKRKKIVSAIFENLLVLLKALCVMTCIVAFIVIIIMAESFGLDIIVIIDSIVALFKWIFTALKTLALISVYIIVILIALDMIFKIIKKIFKRN